MGVPLFFDAPVAALNTCRRTSDFRDERARNRPDGRVECEDSQPDGAADILEIPDIFGIRSSP
jgi:hypothetical protein